MWGMIHTIGHQDGRTIKMLVLSHYPLMGTGSLNRYVIRLLSYSISFLLYKSFSPKRAVFHEYMLFLNTTLRHSFGTVPRSRLLTMSVQNAVILQLAELELLLRLYQLRKLPPYRHIQLPHPCQIPYLLRTLLPRTPLIVQPFLPCVDQVLRVMTLAIRVYAVLHGV